MKRLTLDGVIASAAFASGDRIVVGAWRTGPLGPMNDVMWVNADNRRVLIAPSQQVAEFVTAIYEFDDVEVEPVYVGHTSRSFVVAAGRLHMQLKLGRAWPLPPLVARPPLVTRYVEGPVARRLMNVHTHGVTASGVEEWYRARRVAWVRSANASIDNADLGALQAIQPLRIGVSEPPTRPSVVSVVPTLHDSSGRLQKIVDNQRSLMTKETK